MPVSDLRTKPSVSPPMPTDTPKPVTWPTAGQAEIEMPLAAGQTRRTPGSAQPGGVPITVAATAGRTR